ncbi:hypothetical protein O181_054375 [Austropuccinia psidii MF-1]|uniref:Uncharacterized protein n=1 Tax=Austropuccinia psidii MF-1 TaxID=1389203 RepID=A0A9Q3HUB9_9BASI|nr:hypothetical protein [Austropuccinia psidii MF-1]
MQRQTQNEDKDETQKYLKKKITGAYHEEDEEEEERRGLIPKKYNKTQEEKERDKKNIKKISNHGNKEIPKQDSQKMELKRKVRSTVNTLKPISEQVMKKILEQKMNLTTEEILSMLTTFIDKLQRSTTQEKDVIK